MTQEERKKAIADYKKENNRKVLKEMKIPGVLTLLGVLCIYLADYVFDFQSKWATLPGILLFLIGLASLKGVLEDWGKIPEFEDDPVLNSKHDKLITFLSGYMMLTPLLGIAILSILWTQNFHIQSYFWGFSAIFGIVFSTILYNIMKRQIPGFEQQNKQRLEELGRIWILFLVTGVFLFHLTLSGIANFKSPSVLLNTAQKYKTNDIWYNKKWVSARYGFYEYEHLKDLDSISVEIVPMFLGIIYFKSFKPMDTEVSD